MSKVAMIREYIKHGYNALLSRKFIRNEQGKLLKRQYVVDIFSTHMCTFNELPSIYLNQEEACSIFGNDIIVCNGAEGIVRAIYPLPELKIKD